MRWNKKKFVWKQRENKFLNIKWKGGKYQNSMYECDSSLAIQGRVEIDKIMKKVPKEEMKNNKIYSILSMFN